YWVPVLCQRLCRRFGDARAGERLAGRAGVGIKARAEAVDDRDGNKGGDAAPFLPAMKAAQIVGPHDSNETHPGTMIAQVGDRFVRVARANLRLQAKHIDSRMAGEAAGGGNALLDGGKPARIL